MYNRWKLHFFLLFFNDLSTAIFEKRSEQGEQEEWKSRIKWQEKFQERTQGKKQIIGSFSAEECLKFILSKVSGVSVQMLSQIGAAVVWISKMTLGVKVLPYTGASVAKHSKKK